MQININITIDDRIIKAVKHFFSRKVTIALALLILAGISIIAYSATITKPHTFTPGTVIFSDDVNQNFDVVYDAVNKLVPAGTIVAYGGNAAPTGWLLCDGSEVSRATYNDLYAVIGSSFGGGNGSTTFNVPDLRGVFIRGHHLGSNRDPDFTGRTLGALQSDDFKSHDHITCDTEIPTYGKLGTLNKIYSGGGDAMFGSGGNMRTGFSGGLETRPKNVSANYIIKH